MLYLSSERGVSTQGASFALAAFWVMVTVGRVLIALISQLVPPRWIYVALPALSLVVFQLASQVQSEAGGIIVFGLAGLACSGFLPLSISFAGGGVSPALGRDGRRAHRVLSAGIRSRAFGIGPLQGLFGLSFSTVFAAGSVVAAPIIVIAWLVIRPTRNTQAVPGR
jgi:fucose permease